MFGDEKVVGPVQNKVEGSTSLVRLVVRHRYPLLFLGGTAVRRQVTADGRCGTDHEASSFVVV